MSAVMLLTKTPDRSFFGSLARSLGRDGKNSDVATACPADMDSIQDRMPKKHLLAISNVNLVFPLDSEIMSFMSPNRAFIFSMMGA